MGPQQEPPGTNGKCHPGVRCFPSNHASGAPFSGTTCQLGYEYDSGPLRIAGIATWWGRAAAMLWATTTQQPTANARLKGRVCI